MQFYFELRYFELRDALGERMPQQTQSLMLEAVLNKIQDGLAVTDRDGLIVFANPAFATLHGETREAMTGSRLNAWHCETIAPDKDGASVAWHRRRNGERFVALRQCSSLDPLVGMEGAQSWRVCALFPDGQDSASQSEWALLSSINDLVICLDEQCMYRYVSPHCRDMCGYAPEELLGQSSLAFVHPEDRGRVSRAYEQSISEGGAFRLEYRRLAKSGAYFEVETIGHRPPPSFAVMGTTLVCVVRDIRERKAAENALRDSEARYRLLAEHAKDMISVVSMDNVYQYVSPASEGLLGFRPDELVGRNASEFVHPEDWLWLEPLTADELTMEAASPIEYRRRCKDGSYVWLELTAKRFDEPDSGMPAGIIMVSRDATERKAREAALQVREEVERQILENINGVFWLRDGRELLYVNSAYERIWERSLESLYATPASFLDAVHPDDRARVGMQYQSQRDDLNTLFDEEYRIMRRDGSIRWIWARTFAIRNESGEAWRTAGIAEDITERKEVMEALRKRELQLQQAHAISRLGCWELNVVSGELSWSDSIYELFELDPELFGASYEAFLNAVHPEDRERVDAAYRNSLESRTPYELEHRLLMPDGRVKWVSEICRTEYNESGVPLRSIGTVQEVTERRQVFEALRESKERYRLLAENATDVIARVTLEGTIIYFSPAVTALTGYGESDLLGRNVFEFVHKDDHALLFERQDSLARESQVSSVRAEFRVVRRDATCVWVEATGRVTELADIDTGAEVVAVIRDITERKSAEEAQRFSEERYRLLAEYSTDVIVLATLPGTTLYISPAVTTLLGYDPEALIGQSGFEFVHPDDLPVVKRHETRIAATGDISPFRMEIRMRRRDGSFVWVEASVRVMEHSPDPDRTQLISVLRDISERKAAEDKIRMSNEHLEEMVEERTMRIRELERQRLQDRQLATTSRMAAYIAHEINNPLAGVKNAFRLVRSAVPVEHRHFNYLDLIDRELDRMAFIVRQMFALHRTDMEKVRRFCVFDVMHDVVQLLERKVRQQGVAVVVSGLSENTEVVLPESFLRQVLFNLVSNAVDASPNDSTIELRGECTPGKLVISVIDNGLGILPEVQERLFEPFYSTKLGMDSGMGLGLAIARDLTNAMGGSIDFETEAGTGTVFRVTIPLNDRQDNHDHTPPSIHSSGRR